MSDDRDARTTRLILVHGTYFFQRARKPEVIVSPESTTDEKRRARLRWYEPGSEFREQLASSLRESRIEFTTRLLTWDGRNSIKSRNDAAIALADEIGKLAKTNDPIVVIAHSHGGNVALRAVHLTGATSMANLKVVTLATPFVQIYADTSSGKKKMGSSMLKKGASLSFLDSSLMVALAVPFLLAVVIPAITYRDAMRALLQPVIFIDPLVIAIGAAAPFALFVGYQLSKLAQKWVANLEPARSAGPSREDKPEFLKRISSYSLPQTPEDWLLVLRGVDDEASLTLAAGSIGNRVAHFILGSALPFAQDKLAMLAVPAMIAYFVGRMAGSSGAGWVSDVLVAAIEFGFAGIALLGAITFFLPGIFRSVFGRELIFGSWRCEIAANSSPDGGDGVRVRTLLLPPRLAKRKLRHAIYMNPEVPPCIAKWLRTSSSARPAAETPGR